MDLLEYIMISLQNIFPIQIQSVAVSSSTKWRACRVVISAILSQILIHARKLIENQANVLKALFYILVQGELFIMYEGRLQGEGDVLSKIL